MNLNLISKVAMLAGVIALKSGAETYRVEETIDKIAKAQGVSKSHVYTTPTGIFVYLEDNNDNSHTRVERVKNIGIDLNKVVLINDISRKIVDKKLSISDANLQLTEIAESEKVYSYWQYLLAGSVVGASFSFLFGGGVKEVSLALLASFIIQSLLQQSVLRTNRFFVSSIGGAIAALVALIGSGYLPGLNIDKVIIGAIMTLVPGVAITNAIRDVLHQDYLSGAARGLEAFLVALSIAVGVTLVIGSWILYGGGIKAW